MRWLKKAIRNWLSDSPPEVGLVRADMSADNPGGFNMTFLQAMNGKVIQIRTYVPRNSLGPDWKTEYYVVPEGEKITDALTVLMIAKNLEKA